MRAVAVAVAVARWVGFGLVGLVGLAAAGGAALAALFAWYGASAMLGEWASAVLGRPVVVDGAVSVALGDPIHLHLENVRIANPNWAREKTFAAIAAIDAELRPWPLARGGIELSRLALSQPKLDLETTGRGLTTWTFAPASREEETRHRLPIIDLLVIDRGRARFRDPGEAIDLDAEITTATGRSRGDEVTLEGRGTFAGKAFTLRALGGGLRALGGGVELPDGELGLAIEGGQVASLAVEALKTNILKTLGVILTGSRPMPFACFVTGMVAKKGLMKVTTLALDTPETLVSGGGTLDLGEERLDLRLEGRPKSPELFATHLPVTVRGTLGAPEIGVEAGESAARAAAAAVLGVALTPLAGLLPLIETGADAQSNCAQLIRNAKSPLGKR